MSEELNEKARNYRMSVYKFFENENAETCMDAKLIEADYKAGYHRGQMDVVERLRAFIGNGEYLLSNNPLLPSRYFSVDSFMSELDRIERKIKSHQQG